MAIIAVNTIGGFEHVFSLSQTFHNNFPVTPVHDREWSKQRCLEHLRMVFSKILKPNGDNKKTTYVSDDHAYLHTRQFWTAMHPSGMRLPWEITLAVLNKDALELFHKRTKLFRNMGPHCISQQADPGDLFDKKRSSYADAGFRLARKTDGNFRQQQTISDSKDAYEKWTTPIMEELESWIISKYFQLAKRNNVPPFLKQENAAGAVLEETDTAQSSPRSSIDSVASARHVLGFLHDKVALDSGRIKGHAATHSAKKRKLVQKPAFVVDQIRSFGNCVNDEGRTMYDRTTSCFFSQLIFGCLRGSDGQLIFPMEFEIPMGSDIGHLMLPEGATFQLEGQPPMMAGIFESTSRSCDSMDEEVVNPSADVQAVEEVAGTWGSCMRSEDALLFRHKILRCLHKTADETGLLFKCGHMVSGQYD